ncbi:XRE family transcriptional regulator [Nitratidesulfovibrio termitidis]|uniref:Putative transcriptional regulator n=1 Tax=Nitratidesulfovibrio termitidis HI1 TaxID=644897 RepID=W9E4S0_9BACT|nr:S24 family peptidase [Nitratidesulfovibrio termitidis]ETA73125.1 putative transcriptional regulator [Nitratidesulfovibrio termitidis HI1]
MDTNTIAARIAQVRGNMPRAEFARRIDINANTLRSYESGASLPNSDVILRVCRAFSISTHWLITGEGEMALPKGVASVVYDHAVAPASQEGAASIPPAPETLVCADCELVMVPMVEARLSAGNGSFEVGEDVERRYAFRTDFLLRKGVPSSMVLMRVDGDSMEPYVLNGDVVLIDQSQRETRPGKIYAVGVEDMVYLKVVNAAPGKLVLTSHNAAYPPLEVDARGDLADGIRIIGRAVWVGRELN